MRVAFFAIGLLWASALSVFAQDRVLQLRSGDHGSFTRLVLDVSSASTPEWVQDANGLSIRVPGQGVRISTESLFSRISRARVAGARSAGNTVSLALACACFTRGFVLDGNLFVVDVSSERFTAPLPPNGVAVPPSPALSPVTERAPQTSPDADHAPQPAEDVRRHLTEQLTRALDQGLLKITDDPENSQGTTGAALEDVLTSLRDVPGLHIRSALDGRTEASEGEKPQPADIQCPSAQHLDPNDWKGELPFFEEVLLRRRNLVGEFDDLDPGAWVALAEFYLSYALGEEALNALHQDGLSIPDERREILEEIAAHFSGSQKALPLALAQYHGCPSWGGLWLTIVGGEPLTSENLDFVLNEIANMGPALRMELGPRLVSSYLRANQPSIARAIHDLVDRSASTPSRPHALNAARLLFEDGREREGMALLKELERGHDQIADAARLEVILRSSAEHQADFDARILELELLAQTHRGTDLGEQAFRALVQAYASTGNLSRALPMLDALGLGEGTEGAGATRGPLELLAQASAPPGDPRNYVEGIVAVLGRLPESPDHDAVRIKVASELFDVGLPGLASYVQHPVVQRKVPDALLLQARLEVVRGAPHRVGQLLSGIESAEAAKMRALAAGAIPFSTEQNLPSEEVASPPETAEQVNAAPSSALVPGSPTISLSAVRGAVGASSELRAAWEDRLRYR